LPLFFSLHCMRVAVVVRASLAAMQV